MPSPSTRSLAAGFVTALCLFGQAAFALPVLGPVVKVNQGVSGCELLPRVAPLRSGGFAAAWSESSSGATAVAKLRFADRQGFFAGGELSFPGRFVEAVGQDPAGGVAVVWSSGPSISLQRFSAVGEPLGGDIPLAENPGARSGTVAAAFAADGRLALVWPAAANRLSARWFSPAGVPLTSEVALDASQPFPVTVSAALDAAGRLVAAWSLTVGQHNVVRYRRVDAAGLPGPIVEGSRPQLGLGTEISPQVAASDDGGVTLAWLRIEDYPSTARAIWYRRFDAGDAPLGPPTDAGSSVERPSLASNGRSIVLGMGRGAAYLLPLLPSGEETSLHPEISVDSGSESPALAFLDDGRLAVIWNTFSASAGIPLECDYDGVFERVVDLAPDLPAPQPAAPAVRFGAAAGEGNQGPEVASSPDGGWVALWQGDACAVKSRAFDAAGQPRGPETVVGNPPCTATRSLRLALTALADGGYLAAWAADDAPDLPLQMRRLDAAGGPLGAGIAAGPPGGHRPRLAARAGGGFLLGWAEPGSQALRLQAFTAAGAAEGAPVELAAGAFQGDFDLSALPGGDFAAAWAAEPSRVVARRLADTGLPLTAVLAVSEDDLPQGGPHAAPDAGGGFAVAWTASLQPFARPTAARLRRFSRDGQPRGPVLDAETVQDLAYDLGETLSVHGLAASRDGVLWLLLEKRLYYAHQVLGLAVDDGVVTGPAALLAEANDALPGSVAATPDGCGWLAGWSIQDASHGPYEAEVRRVGGGCFTAPPALRLGGGRFRARIAWRTPPGNPAGSGSGRPIPLLHDSGAFWFFAPENPELMLKVLDGRGVNGAFWVFSSTLTDVALDLVVTDTATGQSRTYSKPQGRIASFADLQAFPAAGVAPSSTAPSAAGAPASTTEASEPTCGPASDALCLDGRFRVGVRFTDPRDGAGGAAVAVPLTPSSGSFWFFAPDNLELLVKIVDGRAVNDRFWFFYGGLSDVRYDITVTDTQTGAQRTYRNRRGTLTSNADTGAFP